MSDTDPLQQMVNLTAAALGVPDVQLVVLAEPGLLLRSDRMVSGSPDWADRLGFQVVDPDMGDLVEPWVRSIAVTPLTGPSGEPGFIIVGGQTADAFDQTTLDVLTRVVALAETHLDRSAERVRLDRLGEVLRSNQEQLQRAKNRLLDSNEELEQFAYIAAHELVAPLRAVSLYSEVLEPLVLAEEIDHAQVTRCVEAIRTGVANMDQQVKQLLELSNLQGQMSQMTSLDLTNVVDLAVHTLAEPLEEAGAVVEFGELPKVIGREVPLQSVFANLFSNALRYSHPSRSLKIRISSRIDAGRAQILVADNGAGVDPTLHDRIFQLFERGSTSTAGSGIGLALSRRIVEAVGGEIALTESSAEGTTFMVSLRLAI